MDADELDAAERRGGSDYGNCGRGALDGVRHAQCLYISPHASLHFTLSRRLTSNERSSALVLKPTELEGTHRVRSHAT